MNAHSAAIAATTTGTVPSQREPGRALPAPFPEEFPLVPAGSEEPGIIVDGWIKTKDR